MTAIADWQARVGDVWAEEWRRTDRGLADLSRHLDAAILAAASRSAHVLDIGCGAGGTTLALACARPAAQVVGIDVSASLIAVAEARRAADRIDNAAFLVGDATTAAAGQGPFDLLVSRHGVMFFADPVAAFRRLHAHAAPGASLVFSCFRDRRLTAFASDLVAALTGTLPADPPDYQPGPFAFADEARVAAILAEVGWRNANATPVDFAYVAGEGDDPVADATSFLSRIGPLASIVATDPAGMRPRLATALARYVTDTRVVLPASAWIWRATKGVS